MCQILLIGDHHGLSTEIGAALTAGNHMLERAAGHDDALQRPRTESFSVVITSCESDVAEDLVFLQEMRAVRPG